MNNADMKQIGEEWCEMTDHMLDGLFMTRQACILDGVLTQEEVDDFIKESARKHMTKYASMDSDEVHRAMATHMLKSMLERLEGME